MTPLLLGLILVSQPPAQAANPSIRGTVVDAMTQAPITDARVSLAEAGLDVRTGPDGRFAFERVSPRAYTLTVSTIGYIFVRRRVDALADTDIELTIPLAEGTGTYRESVTVSAEAAGRPKAIGVSSQMELGSAGLADLRGVAADDPLRAVQALPGVATGDDFRAEFSVRGSAFRHVGLVTDGTPTSLLLHTVRSANDSGSIAMINTDILSRGALFAGPHARTHGDWLGATLEFDVREGSRDRAAARAAVSGTAAAGVFEGPIGTGRRGSWLVSVRRSYIDWLIRKLEPDVDSTIGFSDAQVKLAYDVTPRQQVQLLAIGGDATYREQQAALANGIQTARSKSSLASIAWRYASPHIVVSQRYSWLRGTYENRGMVGQHLVDGHSTAHVWRGDVIAPFAPGWTVEGGGRREWFDTAETLRRFTVSGANSVRLRSTRTTVADPVTSGAWAQLTWRGPAGGVAGGMRASSRSTGRSALTPWLLAERLVGPVTIRGGVGRSAQFADALVDEISPLRLDPERATSYDFGVEVQFSSGVRGQATVFYRRERNVVRRIGEERLDPLTGARIPESIFPLFSDSLTGTSRGVDLLLIRRSATGLSGWVGYTWSHTRHRDGLSGEEFDGDFDQRHTLNVFAQQRLSYRMTASVKLRAGSNFPIVGYFQGTPDALFLSAERNDVRLPFYTRLDVRLNRAFTFERSRLTLFVEVMNLLGRRNGGQSDGTVRSSTLEALGYVERLLPRVPSAGILFEF